MWKRSELKRAARGAIKKNYLRCVIVCLVVLALAGTFNFSRDMNAAAVTAGDLTQPGGSNSAIVNRVVRNLFGTSSEVWDAMEEAPRPSKGVLASVFNNATASGNLLFGVLNSVNQFAFGDSIGAAIVIAVGTVLILLYEVFVTLVLRVGENRFYLENRRYPETELGRIFFVLRVRRVRHVAGIMLLRYVFTFLWFFTIAGGFIKLYSYRMIPYILAENPDISRRDAFRLSREMMHGHKWRTFLLDLSFIGWSLLEGISFNLVYVLYTHPYRCAVGAELYMTLRDAMVEKDPVYKGLFIDDYLGGFGELEEYPSTNYPLEESPAFSFLASDYHRHYSPVNLVLMFFSFCLIGYLWEVVVILLQTGVLQNRGTLYGPWLPIYGVGGMVIILFLRHWQDRPVLTFFLVMAACGVLEYGTAYILETFWHTKWWDYSGYLLNLHGRVCLEGLLVFGLAGTLGIYILGPALDDLFNRIPRQKRRVIAAGLVGLFLTDLAFCSLVHPNTAAAESTEPPVSPD